MPELNHEIDRDNLNKEGSKEAGGLSFPGEAEHYERSPNAPKTLTERGAIYFEKVS